MAETRSTKTLTEAAFKAINAHDPAALAGLFADDATGWDVVMPAAVKGPKAISEYFRGQFKTFPDANIKTVSTIEGGDSVATEIEWTGTQKGPIEMPGMPTIPPTNRKVSGRGVIVSRSKNGKVTSFSVYYDTGSMMQQLGLGPK